MPGQRYDYPCNYLQILENAMDPVHTSFLHTIVSGSQFTDEFGVVPNLDFMETPAGIIYIATRRVGDNIWVRSVENVLPNLQQVAPIWEDGRDVHGFDGPMMTRWIVPRDDQSTMLLELRHISDAEEKEPAWWLDRSQMLPAQLPISDDPREQQLQPGDYEAQVTQRPIAIHGLEHLGATDRASPCSGGRFAGASGRCRTARRLVAPTRSWRETISPPTATTRWSSLRPPRRPRRTRS